MLWILVVTSGDLFANHFVKILNTTAFPSQTKNSEMIYYYYGN
jgi:hypothetical protein